MENEKDITIEEYNQLKKNLNIINEKIQRIEVEKKYKTEQLKTILNKYNVKNVSELRTLRDNKRQEANKVFQEANQYIKDMMVKLSKIDNTLHS